MRVIDSTSTTPPPAPSMFLHGLTGHGKSTWATTGGRPLVVLLEAKAASVLRSINANAVGLVPESIQDLLGLMEKLGNPEWLLKKAVDRIVLDSFTGLTEAMGAWLRADTNGASLLAKSMERQEYGDLGKYALAIVDTIQLTGLPSVIIGRSVSKKVGRDEVIVPDSVGKSIDRLPGKLLPTAEARYDQELGYVIDTTPVDYSQRCGLGWVPQIWAGSCLDYLGIIQAGPQGTAAPEVDMVKVREDAERGAAEGRAKVATEKAAATKKPTPAAPVPQAQVPPPITDPEFQSLLEALIIQTSGRPDAERATQVQSWERRFAADPLWAKKDLKQFLDVTDRLNAGPHPDPEKDPKGYKEAWEVLFREMADAQLATAKATKSTQEVEEFVAGVDKAPPVAQAAPVSQVPPVSSEPTKPLITKDQAAQLTKAVTDFGIPREKLLDYCESKGGMAPREPGGARYLQRLYAVAFAKIWPVIQDPVSRASFIDTLNSHEFIPF